MCLAPPPPPALRTAGKVVIKTLQFVLPPVRGLTVDLEKRVEPIVFTGARFQTKAQGYTWPR